MMLLLRSICAGSGVEDMDDRQVGGQVNSRWSTMRKIDSKIKALHFLTGSSYRCYGMCM